MGIARRRGVDEAQQSLGAAWPRVFAVGPILRAHVHGRRLGQAPASEDVVELRGVVVGKEHVVAQQRPAVGLGEQRPYHRRQ